MPHPSANDIDTICWVLLVPTAGYFIYRVFDRSDSRGVLAIKGIVSIPLIALIIYIQRYHSENSFPIAVKPALLIAPCMALGMLWASNLARSLAGPLLGAIDGGEADGEKKPIYFVAEGKRRKGLYQEAIAELRKQLEEFPGDYEGYMRLASIQMENLKNLPAAQATLDEFIALPKRASNEIVSALHLLADWQLQYGRDAQAAAASLQRIIGLFPDSALAHAAEQRIAHLGSADETRRVRDESRFTVKTSARKVGLEASEKTEPAPEDPIARAQELVTQLELHPSDTDTREKLAVLYAEEFQRLDLATDQLEELIRLPAEPPKRVARWLDLLATLHIRFAHNQGAAEAALQRIIQRFPGGALETVALRRLATLAGELKASQTGASKTLRDYGENLGLKRTGII